MDSFFSTFFHSTELKLTPVTADGDALVFTVRLMVQLDHSPGDEHPGCLPMFAITNKPAKNIVEKVSVWEGRMSLGICSGVVKQNTIA